jgi:hypothetical protein
MYSEWFKNNIYVSPNDNIYCLYPFDNGIKTLIMDEDMKFSTYQKFIKGIEEPKELSEVMVYWMYSEMNTEEETYKAVREIVAEYESNSKDFFKKYNNKNRNSEVTTMENKEIKTVNPAEFFTKWKEMEDYWAKNDGDMDENSYYNRIINQAINIELPLLGIKTELFWCPPTVECIDELYQRMIDDTYFDLLVIKEQCYHSGSGIWIAEVPFEYGEKSLVMVVDNEHVGVWAVYQNILKDNGKYESVEYDELLVESMDANHILPDWQIYYIKALQLLACGIER